MILTEHAKMRYAQRISGIESEEDALQYSMDNEIEVSYGLWSMYAKATLLFENYTYDVERDATGNVFIYKDIIIITTNNQPFKIITLWKSDTADTGRLETHVEGLMAILIAGGVISDPTTHGYDDSSRALRYEAPRKDLN